MILWNIQAGHLLWGTAKILNASDSVTEGLALILIRELDFLYSINYDDIKCFFKIILFLVEYSAST